MKLESSSAPWSEGFLTQEDNLNGYHAVNGKDSFFEKSSISFIR